MIRHVHQARLAEIEARHGVEAESREAVKRLTRRRSRFDDDDGENGDGDGEEAHQEEEQVLWSYLWRE